MKKILLSDLFCPLCAISLRLKKGKIKLFLAKRDIYPEKIVYLSQIKKYTNI